MIYKMSTPSESVDRGSTANPRPKTMGTTFNPMNTSSNRSPFVRFNEVINSFIPVHEIGLRNGFYNSIALIFLLLVLILIYYCYWILKPFLQPLVWATLCGSALHPFKQRLFHCSTKWIKDMKNDGRPITVSTICLPFVVTNKAIDMFLSYCRRYKIFLAVLALFYLLSYFSFFFWNAFYYLIDNSVINTILILLTFLSEKLTNTDYSSIRMGGVIGYCIVLLFGWSDAIDTRTSTVLTKLAPFVWIIFLIEMICLSGTVGYLLSLIIISMIMIGLVKTIIIGQGTNANDQIDGLINFSLKLKNGLYMISNHLISHLFKDKEEEEADCDQSVSDNSDDIIEQNDLDVSKSDQVQSFVKKSFSADTSRRASLTTNGENNKSNLYLCLVVWALVFVQIQNCSGYKIVLFIIIPIIFKSITIGSNYIFNFIINNQPFIEFLEKRKNAIFNPLIRNSYNYFIIGDELIMNIIKSSLNGITSLTIIWFTIICVLFFGIFMSIQIYGESLHLVNSISNVFNKTISYYPESSQLFPQSLKEMDGMLDQIMRNGYEYGRQYIKDSIQNTLNVESNGNLTKSTAVEKQILELWDRAYHLWLVRNSNETDNLPMKGPYDVDKLWTAFTSLDLYLVFNILKENVDFLISVLDSVWLVLKGNATLLFSAIAAVFSILLGGGIGLMNLVLNLVIFTTALFILLSSSGNSYRPIEMVNKMFPSEVTQKTFGRAIGEAVNGVFAASLKMSAFYGLYTFLIHVLFDVDIVYIPSVMAAIFGAVPFLSAFWASFPAFLELFLGQNQRMKALLLLITAYLPAFFVDATIYSEIKSAGHPYLTGLAIAGGVFYLGIEGALFGPILLCFLFVAFNIYSSIMEENTMNATQELTPRQAIRSSQLRRQQSTVD